MKSGNHRTVSTAARGTETRLQHMGSNWTMGFSLRLIWATEYCRTQRSVWLLSLTRAQAQQAGSSQLRATSCLWHWGQHAHSDPRKSTSERQGTQVVAQVTCWIIFKTCRRNTGRTKLNHYSIQCFSKQGLLGRTPGRRACLCMAMNCQREKSWVLYFVSHSLSHVTSIPILGTLKFLVPESMRRCS